MGDDYYVGWTIETELPTGKGTVVDYDGGDQLATVAWESVVTVIPETTTYTLTAPCSAAPMHTNLVIESVNVDGDVYTFREGYAPTARTTDATGTAIAGGIHGVDTNDNFAVECALMRPANRDISVWIPAGQFSDAAGNPNPKSDPFLITMDQTPPSFTVELYEADGATAIASEGTTGSRAAIFKFVATEHVVSASNSDTPLALSDLTIDEDGDDEECANPKFWGWKDTFYLRCGWANGKKAKVKIEAGDAQDLAGNGCAESDEVWVAFT